MGFWKSDLGRTVIAALIPAIVSFVGFVSTYIAMRRNFKEELQKQKRNLTLEKMSTIPYDVLQLYNHMMDPIIMEKIVQAAKMTKREENEYRDKVKKGNSNLITEMRELYNRVYAYGSDKAISILASMQKLNYSNIGIEPDISTRYRIIAHYILLATQIKYDITGDIINPLMWYEINITDFEKMRDTIIGENNKIVEELKLNSGLIAK
ncbi:MAG: hypothetical protein IJV15_05130 [Lachnospiraceae bacterium]|nr:hypothetical protein [Lachnospiraceae bacterium]